MVTFDGLPAPSYYLHLIVIHEFGFLIPFAPFELEFLVIANVVAPKSRPMFRASLGHLILFISTWVSSSLLGYSFISITYRPSLVVG